MVKLKLAETGTIEREGKNNRDKIFEFIYANRDKGARPRDIIKDTGLSKEAVHNHLQVLLNERRIYKRDRRYYPEISIRNEFSSFGSSMSEGFVNLIDKEMMESESDTNLPFDIGERHKLKLYERIKMDFPDKILTIRDFVKAPFLHGPLYLMSMLAGPITSEKYCKTSFQKRESLEKCIFEFCNRIGAYITYIFLQSLYPLQDSKLRNKERGELCKIMIEKGIPLEALFESFRYLMTELGLTGCNLDIAWKREYENLFELSADNFKTISNGFQKVYPNLYIGFENWWLHGARNSLALDTSLSRSEGCTHEWQKITLFKYPQNHPSCYRCKKCHRLSSKPIKEDKT